MLIKSFLLLLLPGSTMSPTNERDAGFCSGSSENEEDLDHHHQMRLISNSSECSSQSAQSSEDSTLGDKFILPATPVTSTTIKNKRKSSEPIRVVVSESQCGPIKKRIKLENEKMMLLAKAQAAKEEEVEKLQQKVQITATPLLSPDPFRPWTTLLEQSKSVLSPAHSFKRHPGVTTLHRVPGALEEPTVHLPQFTMPVQEEPIALIAKKTPVKAEEPQMVPRNLFFKQRLDSTKSLDEPRPAHVLSTSRTPSLMDETSSNASSFISPVTLNLSVKSQSHSLSEGLVKSPRSSDKKKEGSVNGKETQRNYKNMTRERRIEANARERTRVHTISAAFEKLRHSVPAYSNTQKLSKLSVLRIACSYIMSLSRIAGMDYSEDQSEPSIADCVDALTKTIQTEGKLRKKKDE